MHKLPIVSSKDAIKCFQKIGYKIARQKGSHIRMLNDDPNKKPITVPNHKTISKGLLRKLIRDCGLSIEEFSDLL